MAKEEIKAQAKTALEKAEAALKPLYAEREKAFATVAECGRALGIARLFGTEVARAEQDVEAMNALGITPPAGAVAPVTAARARSDLAAAEARHADLDAQIAPLEAARAAARHLLRK